jgi:copper chaperone
MTTFHIPDMSCGHCKATVEKAIHTLDPEARIEFDMETRRVVLVSRTEPANVQAALAQPATRPPQPEAWA